MNNKHAASVRARASAGWTIIEMMVVLTIIGILTALGSTNWITSQRKTRDGARKTEIGQIRLALEMWRSDNDVYPPDLNSLVSDYMSADLLTDSQGNNYSYQVDGPQTQYCLCSILENDNDPDFGSCPTALGCTGDYGLNNP